MHKQEVINLLTQHKADLSQQFGITDLALFGSVARDEAQENSDIDVLVEFAGKVTAKRFFGVQFYLEDLFGKSVDLVQKGSIRPELQPYIEKDLIHV